MLMVEKLNERKERISGALGGNGSDVVSDTELFRQMGIEVRHGDIDR